MAQMKKQVVKKAGTKVVAAKKAPSTTSPTLVTKAITREWERLRSRIERRLNSTTTTRPESVSQVRRYVVTTATDEISAALRPGRPRV